MSIEEAAQQVMQIEKSLPWPKKEGSKKVNGALKCSLAKKLKRYSPYHSIPIHLSDLDEAKL